MTDFSDCWKLYPRKIAKKAARKAWANAIKLTSPELIMLSLRFMVDTEWRTRKPEYIPHMASWLNREEFEDRAEAIEDEQEHPFGLHLCGFCEPPHEWQETGDRMNWTPGYERLCAAQVEAMRKEVTR